MLETFKKIHISCSVENYLFYFALLLFIFILRP